MDNNANLTRKVYLYALIPNIIAVLGGTVNVFFDGILVGRRLGEAGVTGISQALPVYLALCMIGSLFASGGSYLSSLAFGANDRARGEHLFRSTLTTSALAGLAFSLIALALSSPLARLLSSADTFQIVLTYIRITLIGGVFKVILYVPFFYLRLEGKNDRSAVAMVAMMIINVLLDYLFLFVYDMGIAGAAWASVIATVIACALSFGYLFTDHSNFRFGVDFFRREDWLPVMKYGSPMAINNILSSFRILVLNLILQSMDKAEYLAIFAVINYVCEFSICIQNGVPQTASAMTGIFHGEQDARSVKFLLKTELLTGTVLSAVFSLFLCIFSGRVGVLFGSSSDCRIGAWCFAVSLLFATANSVMSYYFNATGRIGMSNLITVCRGFVFLVVFCMIFRSSGQYVWLYYPAAEIATAILWFAVSEIVIRRRSLSRFYMIDESFERSGRAVSFTTDCTAEKICQASEQIRGFCEENELTPKKTMVISLAIEEMLTIIAQKSLKGKGTMDVRVLKSGDAEILRIRSAGARYNPIEEKTDDPDYMGMQMISKIAKKTEYYSTLGVNSLLIFL